MAGNFCKIINKLKCPLTSAVIQLAVIIIIYFLFSPSFTESTKSSEYKISILHSKIDDKVDSILNKCGQDYFVAWLVLNTDKHRNYIFKDVYGCNQEKGSNCKFSVKNLRLNSFYNKEHALDKDTFKYIKKILSGEIVDITTLKDYNFKSINELIKNMNLPVKDGVFTVIKRKEENVIYIFSLMNIKESKTCNKKEMSYLLRELGKLTRRGL